MMAENTQNGGVRLKEGHDRRLFPVLQQAGKPYQEIHPTGDQWLQSMWKEGGNECNITWAAAGSTTSV